MPDRHIMSAAAELYDMAVDADDRNDAIQQIAQWLESYRTELWNDGFRDGEAQGRAYTWGETVPGAGRF